MPLQCNVILSQAVQGSSDLNFAVWVTNLARALFTHVRERFMHAAIKVTHDLSAVSLGLSCKRFYSPDRPREGPGMALRSPGRGQGKGSGSPRKSPGRTQDGSGSAPRRLMVQGGNEGEGKSRGDEVGREVGGFEFPFLWPEGEGSRLFPTRHLFCPEHVRRGF